MYCFELDCYERAVRTEDRRQETCIINCYVHLGFELAQRCNTASETKNVYLRLVSTLEETFCDPLLSKLWRQKSYRVIKQILPVIYEMTNKREYTALAKRLSTLSEYFLDNQPQQQSQFNKR
jgi:hypothetical protein